MNARPMSRKHLPTVEKRRYARSTSLLLTLVLAPLSAACFSDRLTEPGEIVRFTADVQPIFSASCASSGCHGAINANPAAKPMVLESGLAYASIVDVSSAQLPSMSRITPGDPERSYVLHKLRGTHLDEGGSGGRMPPTASQGLPAATIDVVRRWIAQGAPQN